MLNGFIDWLLISFVLLAPMSVGAILMLLYRINAEKRRGRSKYFDGDYYE